MVKENSGFGTKAIHGGKMKDTQYGALTMPIYQTSTFEFDCCEQGGRRFAGEEKGYIYTRLGNPSISAVENKVALLEGGEACAAASSGMGAVSACLWSIAGAGKHILADETLYGCTFALLNHGMTRYGVEVTFVDTSDLEQVKANLKENTVCVYLETPANPNLKISDIQAVAELAHAYNPAIQVVCDNTFASPYLQRPLELGADVVIHSATKYLNGHGDVIAGFVVGTEAFINVWSEGYDRCNLRALRGILDYARFKNNGDSYGTPLCECKEGCGISGKAGKGRKGLLSRTGDASRI